MIDKNKKQIMEGLMGIIEEISDKEYQKKVWILGEGEYGHDFDETVNCFFDIGRGVFENYSEYELTATQKKLLQQFQKRFEQFSDENGRCCRNRFFKMREKC